MVAVAIRTIAFPCLLPFALAHGMSAQAPSESSASSATAAQAEVQHDRAGLLSGGWLEPWVHGHYSRRGTPFVHMFGIEPAYLQRDLILTNHWTDAPGETETELEAELEWAFTKRLGLLVEAPLVHIEEDGGDKNTGIGDLAFVPRALLVDTDLLLMTANLELTLPTGDEDKGLGAGESFLAPSLSIWADLGDWITFQSQAGLEYGTDSKDRELFYAAGVAYTFLTTESSGSDSSAAAHDGHLPAGMMSAIIELGGRTALTGDEAGGTTAEMLFGACYTVNSRWELRAGLELPVGGPRDIDSGFIVSAIYHF